MKMRAFIHRSRETSSSKRDRTNSNWIWKAFSSNVSNS